MDTHLVLDQGGVVTLPARRGGEIALRDHPRMHIKFGTGLAPLLRKLEKWVVVPEAVSRCRAPIDRTHRSSGQRRRGVASLTRILDDVVRVEEVSAAADPPALSRRVAGRGAAPLGAPGRRRRKPGVAGRPDHRRAGGAPAGAGASAKSGGRARGRPHAPLAVQPRGEGRVCRDALVPGARRRAPGLPRPGRSGSCRAARGGARTGPGAHGAPRTPAALRPAGSRPPRPAPAGGQRVCRHGGGVAPPGRPARRPRAELALDARRPGAGPITPHRSRRPVRRRRLPAGARGAGDRPPGAPGARVPRRHAEDRTRRRLPQANTSGGAHGDLRVARSLLQPAAFPLGARLPAPSHVRGGDVVALFRRLAVICPSKSRQAHIVGVPTYARLSGTFD